MLLSSMSAALVGEQLPEGTELRFIRSELLRGIDRLEAIHELLDTRRQQSPPPPDDGEGRRTLPPPIESALPAVFVGRDRPLREIEAARQRALEGVVQTVLLGGEPGAGKSTIAAVAARDAHQHGWTVLFGSCDEHVTTPYEPFRDALGQYFEEAPSAVLAEHIAAHGGEVGRLAPSLSARVGALPPVEAADPETSRRLLFEGITDLLRRAAADAPVLIVLDDIQWADRNTTLLIGQLAKLRDARLALLATYRSTTADRPDFDALMAQLRATPGVTDVSVDGLTDGELVTLLEAAAGHPLDAEGRRVARHLHEETDGNPFFVAELVRHFIETGVLVSDEAGTWRAQVDLGTVAIPGTVRGVLHERIGRLSDEAQRVLAVAAVAGRQFDSPLIADVLGIGELTVVDEIESTMSASLVRELTVGRFEFTHALVQHALYDGLSTTRRALHHRQVALALATRTGVPAAEVAMHWAASGPDSRGQIADWARRAGDDALGALSPEDAISWFRLALDATDDDAERLDLLIALGGAQRWADADAFRQTLLDAAALAEHLGDDAALIRAALANNHGGASRAGAVDLERVAVLERALEVVGSHDSTERACLLALLALELSQGGEWERRLELADEAVACARRIGDEATLLRVLLHTTEATRLPATLDRRLIDIEEMFDIAKRLGDPVLLGIAALREARVKIEAAAFDQVSEAVAVLDDVADLDPYLRHNRPIIHAVLAHVAGDLPGALAFAEEARVAGETQADAAATYAATTSQVLWDSGSLGTMVPMIEATLRARPGVTGFRGLLGVGYCEVGRFDEARAILRHEVDTDFAEHPLNPLWLVTMSLFASLSIELEDADAAAALYRNSRPVARPGQLERRVDQRLGDRVARRFGVRCG